MASMRFLHMSFFFFFLVVLVLLVSCAHADDKSEVEKACGQTPHPDVCVSCVNSDPSRNTTEIPELTFEILFCMMSEATHGHEVADLQAQNTSEPNLKQALQTCNVSLFSASNDLTDSFMRLEGKDYQKAEADLESANRAVVQCYKAFLKEPVVTIPPQLFSHVDLAARYHDVAHVFFRLIRK
ncbi:hypothetical protein AAG906_038563 [Vitis piasezkii]